MEGPSPIKLAWITAAAIGLVALVACLVGGHFFLPGTSLGHALLVAAMVFVTAFFVVRFVIQHFIFEKVKLVYRTINSAKGLRKDLKDQIRDDRDVLGTVNQQVITWAEERNREVQDLKDMEEYRREFLGNISHELKTPIFNIQGYLHTLLDGGLEDPEINRKYLRRADKSVDRMISLVEDLDLITQLESGRLSLNKQPVNLLDLAREVIELQEQKAAKRHVRVRLNKKYDRSIMVMADPDRIKQVYINLIDNAIKYGANDGTVELRFFDMEPAILCEVADDGPGIDAEHLPRLFERFFRTDKARNRDQGGTGLGLSIVKHIVEAHGQSIVVRSQTDGQTGTTFGFTLDKVG